MFSNMYSGTKYLEKAIDASVLRGQVIAHNIANAETPGFKSSSVEFETIFEQALRSEASGLHTKMTREKHRDFDTSLDRVNPVVVRNSQTNMRMDGNNVDIDYQNAQLAKNQLYYNTLIEKLNSEFTKLATAIQG